MRHMKILGLLAVAAAATMALAGSASADWITTETSESELPTKIHAVNDNGHNTLHNSSANIECNSTIEGHVKSEGHSVTVKGVFDVLNFTSCTNGWTVQSTTGGSFEIHHTSGYNGTVTSSGTTVTAVRHTIFGTFECRYLTNNTPIGTITAGNPATLIIEASIPFHGGSALCGEGNANWTGSYVTTHSIYIKV